MNDSPLAAPRPVQKSYDGTHAPNQPETMRSSGAQPGTLRASANRIVLLVLLAAQPVLADPPRPFVASYDASYQDFSADAERSLRYDPATQQYVLQSTVELTLFGATLTAITERSEFLWVDEQPLPQHYEFVQEGLGARSRSVDFDHSRMLASFRINDDSGVLTLDGPVFDELSGYLMVGGQVAQGANEVRFKVVDRGEIREHYYQIRDRDPLDTPLGSIPAVHLERIRGEDSTRKTEIWLAPGHDFLLLKLLQTEPSGNTIQLDIREATLDGKILTATPSQTKIAAAGLKPFP